MQIQQAERFLVSTKFAKRLNGFLECNFSMSARVARQEIAVERRCKVINR